MYVCVRLSAGSGMLFQLSKAAMLQKGADYIRQLRAERSQLRDEMDNLRQQIECLNTAIRYLQLRL
jgi:MAX-like protein X